jgi:hypothetical protein
LLEQASCAEDCGNSVPYPGDGESFGKLPSSTAAAGNFVSEDFAVVGICTGVDIPCNYDLPNALLTMFVLFSLALHNSMSRLCRFLYLLVSFWISQA